MTRAHLRVVLAAVVACSPALVGASIASASAEPEHGRPVAAQNIAHHEVAAKPFRTDSVSDHAGAILKAPKDTKIKQAGKQASAPLVTEQDRPATGQHADDDQDDDNGDRLQAVQEHSKSASRSNDRGADQDDNGDDGDGDGGGDDDGDQGKDKKCSPLHHVVGLSEGQTWNARMIVRAGSKMHIGYRGKVIAMATSLQETHLKNYANVNVPVSMHIQHEAVGSDHDSVGLFQQRPNPPWGAGSWGTPKELMDPQTSATKFYQALRGIPGWKNLPVTVAAQRVQVSAFPSAYADDADLARQIVDKLKCP